MFSKKDDVLEDVESPDAQTGSRYIVDDMPLAGISGKRTLQRKLDKGEANGYTLRQIVPSDKHDYLLVVWERPSVPEGHA